MSSGCWQLSQCRFAIYWEALHVTISVSWSSVYPVQHTEIEVWPALDMVIMPFTLQFVLQHQSILGSTSWVSPLQQQPNSGWHRPLSPGQTGTWLWSMNCHSESTKPNCKATARNVVGWARILLSNTMTNIQKCSFFIVKNCSFGFGVLHIITNHWIYYVHDGYT